MFIEIKPIKRRFDGAYLRDKIRVSIIRKQNSSTIRIYIGKEIARKFALEKGSRLVILANDEDNILQLKKDVEGYKLGQLGNQLVLQAIWPFSSADMKPGLRFVTSGIGDGNLELKLPARKDD